MADSIYRPFTIAKAGELAALRDFQPTDWVQFEPVMLIPGREWDYESESWGKTIEAHLDVLPAKIAGAVKSNRIFIDLTLLDSDPLVHGVHPLEWLHTACATAGVTAVPLVRTTSTPDAQRAFTAVQARYGLGAGLRLAADDWLTVSPGVLPQMLTTLGIAPDEVDLFLDVEHEFGALVTSAADREIDALLQYGSFRSISLGGSAFPPSANVPKGVSEFARDDWSLFRAVRSARQARSAAFQPDFLDYVVVDPDSIDLGVDPRVLNISASLRYTSNDEWLWAKGGAYKASGGKSQGGAALKEALEALVGYPGYGSPIRTDLDRRIDDILNAGASYGNPQSWRTWATERHVRVTNWQIANLL